MRRRAGSTPPSSAHGSLERSHAAEARVGRVLDGKWTLERLIGAGGMGAVYAARHRNGARAAVKVLSLEAGSVPHIRKRFLHEGYAANRVDHPGAVRVLDDDVVAEGPDAGTAYIVMELLEGESLHERAARGPLGERDLLEIADDVLAVLAAAHANGVVHRDLKPENLFLLEDTSTRTRTVKVLDFGLARLAEAQEHSIAGIALGTATYMSPEQAAGRVDEIDGRTDLFALGSILFQLISGRRLHDAEHLLGIVVRTATVPAPKLRSVAPAVSEAFTRVVDRALELRREDRYPNAEAMREDVRRALASLRETREEAALAHATTVLPPTVRERSRRRPAWPKAGAFTVAAIAFLLFWESRVATAPRVAGTTTATLEPAVLDAGEVDDGDAAPGDEDDDDTGPSAGDDDDADGEAFFADAGAADLDAGVVAKHSGPAIVTRSAVARTIPKAARKPKAPRHPGHARRKKRWHW